MLSRMHLISPSSWSIKFKNVSCSPSRFPSKEATFYLKQYPSILIHCRGKATNGDQDSSLSKCRERENSQITLAKKDLLPIDVPILNEAPTSLEFLRNYVSSNVPFVLKKGIKQWPAYRKWTDSYLREQLHNNMCTVAVTPNGYADAILEDKFMLPEERTVTFNEFLDEINCPVHDRVLYLQKQNNCLVDEFSCLMKDVCSHIPWATEALGDLPEAVNFWMGDSRAVTSLHKDHYENIYCVVRGSKEFILYPPILAAWVPYKTFKKNQYFWEDGKCKIKDLDDEVKWIPFDPKLKDDVEKFPMVSQLKKYHIILEAGDMLYLPALWFHHVEQSHSCIAGVPAESFGFDSWNPLVVDF